MRVVRILGVAIVINPFFGLLLLLSFLTGVLSHVFLLFAIVLWHESAHMFVAKLYRMDVVEIELLPFGGVAKIEDLIQMNPTAEAWVAAAGPLSNLLLLGGGLLTEELAIVEQGQLQMFMQVNIVMAVFNLAPGLPLDGGRILRSRLMASRGYRQATEKAASMGKVVAVVTIGLGLLGLYQFQALDSLLVVILGCFLYLGADKEGKTAPYAMLRYLNRKRELLQQQPVMDVKSLAITKETRISEIIARFSPPNYHVLYLLDGRGHPRQLIGEIQVIDWMFNEGGRTRVGELLRSSKPPRVEND